MAYSSYDPFRNGRVLSDAYVPFTSAVNAPRPEWDKRATGPRFLVADGVAGLGAYFQPGEEKLPMRFAWDGPPDTVPGLAGLGGVLDGAKSAYNQARSGASSAQSAVSNPQSALQAAGVDPNTIAQAVIPAVKSAVQTGVEQGFKAAWPTIQAKLQPLQQKAVAGIATLTIMQALTLAGVGYLAYRAYKK